MRARGALWLLLAACADAPQGPPAGGETLAGASLLLATLDTTRADALGCYGGPPWTTPRLDGIAEGGVRFAQARSTSPVTLPSHATILTGTRPFEHGVRDNSTFRLPTGAETLAERLARRGYATAAVVGALVLHSEFGLDQGFGVYSDAPRRKLELDVVEDQRTADEVVDAALALFDAGKLAPPFFLWVHFFDPHRPLAPPEPFRSRALAGATADTPPGEVERRLYLAEVAHADAQLGRLIDGIAARAGDAGLLIAAVADHGEAFGEHGEESHGLLLYDTTMRVPLLLWHPRLPAGLVVERAVSTADLAPTLLGLLGIDAAGTSGRDLRPLLADPRAELPGGDAPVYLETCHPLYSYGWSPLFGLVEDGQKLLLGPEPAVYDLAADPRELANLAAEDGAELERAREALRRLAPATREGERIELGESDRRALVELGYAGAAADGGRGAALAPGELDPALADPAVEMAFKELCQVAVAHLEAGDLERAVAEIRRVVERDGENPIYLSQAGTILIRAQRPGEAVPLLERLLARREDPSARCSLAVAHNLLGNKDAALAALRLNARLHPHHLHTRFALGELLLERGDAPGALEQFEAFLAQYAADDAWQEAARVLADRARAAAAPQGHK